MQEVNRDTEVAGQPVLVRVIKTEMASQEFGVRVELIETHSRKDIHTSDQVLQSPQRRMMNPKAGREEKTRKMARAKIINFPSLPVKLPCNLKVADLVIACNSGQDDHMGEGARRNGRFPRPEWRCLCAR